MVRRQTRTADSQRAPRGPRPAPPKDGVKPLALRPAPNRPLTPEGLLALYRPDIAEALRASSSPPYRYQQVLEHLLRRASLPLAQATALPADVRAKLEPLGATTLAELETRTSLDGATKILLSTGGGNPVETVLMRYRDRLTVCASSQVGCRVGCLFCATGQMGFQRNLSAAEIVDQVRACSVLGEAEGRRIGNVVFMGMGEPLLNLRAVLASIRILTDPRGLGLSHRAVSVSTIGIPNGIRRLAEAEPQVNLALSLHAPDDRTRALLVPERFRHPVAEILEAAWEHFALTRRKLLVEYVLIKGINDSADQARALAGLLRGHVVAVNLLNWNPVRRSIGQTPFRPSDPVSVKAFRDVLVSAHIETVLRQSKGAGIDGACGQLAGRCHGAGLKPVRSKGSTADT